MHQQDAAVRGQQRQVLQEVLVVAAELVVRPLRALFPLVLDVAGRVQRHVIVVAAHGPGALLDGLHDRVQHLGGRAAVADQIAQERQLRGGLGAGVVHAGLQGLEVGVDVGEQGQFHGRHAAPPSWRLACSVPWGFPGDWKR